MVRCGEPQTGKLKIFTFYSQFNQGHVAVGLVAFCVLNSLILVYAVLSQEQNVLTYPSAVFPDAKCGLVL